MTLWKNMTGEERYRVLELVRDGKKPVKEICATFGVSKQMLYQTLEKAEKAAMEALEPKKPGRKPKSEEDQQITELLRTNASLEGEKEQWKTRYDIAQAYINLMREHENDAEEVEEELKKNSRTRRKRTRKKNK